MIVNRAERDQQAAVDKMSVAEQDDNMDSSCSIAFKEWAVIAAALRAGRQSLILRKGGIHEGVEGFRVAHPLFWIFPTQFHQSAEQLSVDGFDFISQVTENSYETGVIPIDLLCQVEQVFHIEQSSLIDRLEGAHIWSRSTLEQRFGYREPGLFALLVRVYQLKRPIELADKPHFAGCRSWVELPERLPTLGVDAVLSDEEFARQSQSLRLALST